MEDLSKVYDEFYGYGRMPKDVIEECPQYLYLGRSVIRLLPFNTADICQLSHR